MNPTAKTEAAESEHKRLYFREALQRITGYEQIEGTDCVTSSSSKNVILEARTTEQIRIEVINQFNDLIPLPDKEVLKIVDRAHHYHGTKLTLAEVDDADRQYFLTCPSPNMDLLLWGSIQSNDPPEIQTEIRDEPWGHDRDHPVRLGRIPLAEVSADFEAIADGDFLEGHGVCDECGEEMKDRWHARMSLIGRCPRQREAQGPECPNCRQLGEPWQGDGLRCKNHRCDVQVYDRTEVRMSGEPANHPDDVRYSTEADS